MHSTALLKPMASHHHGMRRLLGVVSQSRECVALGVGMVTLGVASGVCEYFNMMWAAELPHLVRGIGPH